MTRWIALAVVGLLLAAGASYAASRIATQPIGLSSEPIDAGSDLAPRVRRTPRPAPTRTATPTSTPTRTATPVPTVDDSGSDDSGGGGKGRDHPEDD
jgi:hypothetical protein